MKKAKELLNILEVRKDIKRLADTDVLPQHKEFFDYLKKSGMKVAFDPDKMKGAFVHKGITVPFNLGGENLYIELPKLFFKNGSIEAVEAVKALLDVVNNWGGAI